MIRQIVLLGGITLFAYFIKGLTGFGNTLVMNSLFSFFTENRFTTPVDLLLGIPTNIYMAWKNRKGISLKTVLPLSVMVVLGNIPGILLLSAGSDQVLKIILGAVLIFLSIDMMIPKKKSGPGKVVLGNKPLVLWGIGLISGVLMGLFGIGALLAGYLTRRSENRNEYRGNLCCVFIVDNVFRFCGYLYRGILHQEIFRFALFLFPAAVVGMAISHLADWRLNETLLRKIVLILLMLSGAALILKNI